MHGELIGPDSGFHRGRLRHAIRVPADCLPLNESILNDRDKIEIISSCDTCVASIRAGALSLGGNNQLLPGC